LNESPAELRVGPNASKAELRVEASTFEWNALSDAQKAAGLKAAAFVQNEARQDWPPNASAAPNSAYAFLPVISSGRRSRVVLIDGARGTGKTSLLLTLLDRWSRAVRNEEVPRVDGLDAKLPIVPIGLLDLRQLREASMMLQLTLTLKAVIRSLQPLPHEAPSPPPVPWSPHATTELASLAAWRSFFSAVAGGWDTNLGGRAARLDAETYSAELEQSATEARTVNVAFNAFLDALVSDYARVRICNGSKPLFVISIDDADMNPQKSMELLDLLSMLNHPRLVFLMTGDTRLFKTALQRHYSELLGQGRPNPNFEGPQTTDAIGLANQYYAKVIPGQQRCALESLGLTERVKCLETSTSAEGGEPTFKELADKVKNLFEEQLSTAHGLPGQFRELIDLGKWLARPQTSGASQVDIPLRLAELAVRLWEDAIEEEPSKPTLRQAVTSIESVKSRLESVPLVLADVLAPRVERAHQLVDVVTPDHLRAAEHGDSYELKFQAQTRSIALPSSRSGPTYADAERLAAAWEFACNVKGQEPASAEALTGDDELECDHRLAGLECRSGTQSEFCAWPFPKWAKASANARVRELWSSNLLEIQHQLSEAMSEDDRIAAYLSVYFHSILECLRQPAKDEKVGLAVVPDWRSIARTVVALWAAPAAVTSTARRSRSGDSSADRVARAWARQGAPLLFTPAFGVPASFAQAAITAFAESGADDWNEIFVQAYESRESPTREKLDALARKANHPWFERIDSPSTAQASAARAKAQASAARAKAQASAARTKAARALRDRPARE